MSRRTHDTAPGRTRGSLLRSRGAVVATLLAALGGGGGAAGLCVVALDDPNTQAAQAIKAFIPQVDPRSLSGPAYQQAVAGGCLSWRLEAADRLQSIAAVDCAQPHAFEVAGRVDLVTVPGHEPGSPFPDAEGRARIGEQQCVPLVERYTGGRAVDPAGRFAVTVVPPSQEGWDKGDHSVLCGLTTSELDGTPTTSTGHYADADQHRVWEPGTCLGFSATGMPGAPVPCARDHAIEIVSVLDVSEVFPAGAEVPDPRAQSELTGTACHQAGATYVGDPEALRRSTLIATQVSPLSRVSWSTGSRRVNCGVMKARDQSSFAVLSGSVRERLLVDGSEPVAPSTTTIPAPAPAPGQPTGSGASTVVPTGPGTAGGSAAGRDQGTTGGN